MADKTRTRLLKVAGPIFAEKGYEATTVREICDVAGTNLASVNYHFGDKETLYQETIRLAHSLRVKRVPSGQWPDDASPKQKLEGFIRMLLTRMIGLQEPPWQMKLMMREILNPTGACRALVEDFIRPEFHLLLGILRELIDRDLPDYRYHQCAFSIIGQCLHYRIAQGIIELLIPAEEQEADFTLDALVDHITNFSLQALRGIRATAKRTAGEKR